VYKNKKREDGEDDVGAREEDERKRMIFCKRK
jgi:hypothetical protein